MPARKKHRVRQGGASALVVPLVLLALFARLWTPMSPPGWAPPGFCHAIPATGDDGAPAAGDHDHCPLCQAAFGTPPAPLNLPTIRFAALRAAPVLPQAPAPPGQRAPYISRAPPAA